MFFFSITIIVSGVKAAFHALVVPEISRTIPFLYDRAIRYIMYAVIAAIAKNSVIAETSKCGGSEVFTCCCVTITSFVVGFDWDLPIWRFTLILNFYILDLL